MFNIFKLDTVIDLGSLRSIKYSVCMNFLKCLEMQDDEMLLIQGGTNDWVIYIAIIFIVAVFSIGMFAAL